MRRRESRDERVVLFNLTHLIINKNFQWQNFSHHNSLNASFQDRSFIDRWLIFHQRILVFPFYSDVWLIPVRFPVSLGSFFLDNLNVERLNSYKSARSRFAVRKARNNTLSLNFPASTERCFMGWKRRHRIFTKPPR